MADFNRRITLSTAITDFMGSMGLVVPVDVTASLDKTVIQLRYIVNKVGPELINEYGWQMLDRDFTVVTDGVTLSYPLPADFDRFYQDAAWNRTTRMPAMGSLTPEEWAQVQARNLGGTTFAVLYVIQGDKLVFYSVGTTPQTIVLPYISRAWVRSATGVLKDNLVANDDVILFDPALFRAALKLGWQLEKGFDTALSKLAYDAALSAATGKDTPARTLSLAASSYPFISDINLPVTGYGA